MQVLPTGANQPLGGSSVTVEITASSLAGVCVVAEADGRPAPLPQVGPMAKIARSGAGATVTLDLDAVGADVARLRLLLWSESATRALAPVEGRVVVGGTPTFRVSIDNRDLRSAELVEVYRRTGQWKIRTIASGWVDHVPAMAAAVGLPVAAFSGQAAPSGAPSVAALPPTVAPRPRVRTAHQGPSPAVGPQPLRALLDSIVGPGPRSGGEHFVNFEVAGVSMRLGYDGNDDMVQVIALLPLGRGPLNDGTAEIALRVTGESPLARVSIDDDGAVASAMAVVPPSTVDSALLKALLSEAWVAGLRFARRAERIGWTTPADLTEQVPRELRLGVAEDLQEQEVWRELRDRLVLNDLMPLADEPAALLALTDQQQLWIGPSVLAGTSRAWAIIVERVLRSDVLPRAGTWQSIQSMSNPFSPVRLGVIEETGTGGHLAVTASFSALQLPRTQVMDDLQLGLNFVDDRAEELEPLMRRVAPDASNTRNNLPWVQTRTWNGPGSELRDQMLVREVSGIATGGGVPSGLADRMRQQQATLGRPGLGYLGHLALQRAERTDGAAPAWRQFAREVLALVPAVGPGDACAAGSLHVRMKRLDGAQQVRRPAPASSPSRARPSRPTPAQPVPTPAPAPSGAPGGPNPARKKRWRLFG